MAVKDAVRAGNKQFVRTSGLRYVVGSHVSVADGIYNSVDNSVNTGGNAFAIFLKSQRRWTSKPYPPQDVKKFIDLCSQQGYDRRKHILPHSSYLINLGNPDDEKRDKAIGGFLDDLSRCEELGIGLYNIHPGSAMEGDKRQAIERIADGINRGHKQTEFVTVVLENMAGHGRIIGSTLEDLKDIIELVEDKSRIGVCIDTCHTFAAGYDLRDEDAFTKFWDQYDKLVGYKYLRAIHLNDSKAPLGSNRDLHQSIGWGFLGLETFRLVMNKPELEGLPMVLETPTEPHKDVSELRGDEIKLLEWLIGRSKDDKEFLAKQKELQDLGAKERAEHQQKYDSKQAKDKGKDKAKTNKAQRTLNFQPKPKPEPQDEEDEGTRKVPKRRQNE